MLIVAIPKSASTSLMDTLGKRHDLPAKQIKLWDYDPPSNLSVLHRYHSDIREITDEEAKIFSDYNGIFKQHVPPTENNVSLLEETRKVILLREPKDIVDAYFRAEKAGLHEPRPEFAHAETLPEWRETAKAIGLLGDLEWFHQEWTHVAKSNSEANLIITYEDLISDPKQAVNQVEAHFGLPISEELELSRKRYSRDLIRPGLIQRLRTWIRG